MPKLVELLLTGDGVCRQEAAAALSNLAAAVEVGREIADAGAIPLLVERLGTTEGQGIPDRDLAAVAIWRLALDDKVCADVSPVCRRVDLGDPDPNLMTTSFRAATRAAGAVPLLEALTRCGHVATEDKARRALTRIQAWFH